MTDKEKDLVELLNIFMNIVEANKGIPAGNDGRILDAEGLALKFFGHVLSTLYLYRGVNITDLQVSITSFPDPASVHVLARAALETYLLFYYVYIDPKTKDEKDFRFFAWELAGLNERQKFPVTTLENEEKLKREKTLIDELTTKINDNAFFSSLPQRQQKNILERGNWRSKSWGDIALSAGFSEINAKTIYRFLCEHAHSGNLSVTQVRQAKDFHVRKELMEGTIGLILICLANFIKNYCELFPQSNEYYLKNYRDPSLVALWVGVGA